MRVFHHTGMVSTVTLGDGLVILALVQTLLSMTLSNQQATEF